MNSNSSNSYCRPPRFWPAVRRCEPLKSPVAPHTFIIKSIVAGCGLCVLLALFSGVNLARGAGTELRSAQPAATKINTDRSSVFAKNIQPLLNDYCVSCHGPERTRAGLRLDSYEALVTGGDSGPALVAGKSADSPLILRLHLPVDDDEHMPPKTKPQPTEPEVALLAWWIDQGASPAATLDALKVNPAIAHLFATHEALPLQSREAVAPVLAALRGDPVFRVDFLALDDARIRVRARSASDADLDRLKPVRANLAEMDLTGSPITDAGMEVIAAMVNLQQLNLRGTAITDVGAARLEALSWLVSINFYGTKITDATLTILGRLPKLKRVGLWDTQVSKEGVARLQRTLYPEAKSEKLRLEIEQLRQQRDALNVEIVSAFDFGLQATTNATEAPKGITIANVMINYHKDKNSAVNLAREGKGNREDLERLVDYYQAMQKLQPPKGSPESWQTLMTELVAATQDLIEDAPDAVDRFAVAVDCRACHSQHRPK
jgi:mono/diheme cytochrome c family protein